MTLNKKSGIVGLVTLAAAAFGCDSASSRAEVFSSPDTCHTSMLKAQCTTSQGVVNEDCVDTMRAVTVLKCEQAKSARSFAPSVK